MAPFVFLVFALALLASYVNAGSGSSVAYKPCGQDYGVTSWTPYTENGYLTFDYQVEAYGCGTQMTDIIVNSPTCQACSSANQCYNSYWSSESCCTSPYWQTQDAFLYQQGIVASGQKFSNLAFTEYGTLRWSLTVPKTSSWAYGSIYIKGSSYTKCQVPVPVCSCCAPCPNSCFQPTSTSCACSNCTSCNSGAYQTSACTSTSNRVCTNCTTCVAGSTYESSPCTATSNRVCSYCSSCVAGSTYQSSACTATSNRVCSYCSSCVLGSSYQVQNCNATSNRVCASCSNCVAGVSYQTQACTTTSNRVCTNCTTCAAGTYQSQACTTTTNRVCNACTNCVLGTSYQTQPCNVTSNRVCAACSNCVAGVTYQNRSCSATQNRMCTTCATCLPGVTYQAQNCTTVSNRVCNNCTTCVPGVTYQAQNCNATSNRVCASCTSCTSGLTYEAAACNVTSDRICNNCTVCTFPDVQASVCNATHDAVCTPCPLCATCPSNAYLSNDGRNCTCNSGFMQDTAAVNFTCIPTPCCLDCKACNFNVSQTCVVNDPALCDYSCFINSGACSNGSSSPGYNVTLVNVTYNEACCFTMGCTCFIYQISTNNVPVDNFILGTSCPLSICSGSLTPPPCLNDVSPIASPALSGFFIRGSVDTNTGIGGIELTGLGLSAAGPSVGEYTFEFSGILNVSSIPIIYAITGTSDETLTCYVGDVAGPDCISCSPGPGVFEFSSLEIDEPTIDSVSVDVSGKIAWYTFALIPIGFFLVVLAVFAIKRQTTKGVATTAEKVATAL